MSEFETVAQTQIVGVFPEGDLRSLKVRIGKPRQLSESDWVCPLAVEGLLEGPTELHGVDSWHALMVGVRFLREILQTAKERGAIYHWPDGSEVVELSQLFILGPIE